MLAQYQEGQSGMRSKVIFLLLLISLLSLYPVCAYDNDAGGQEKVHTEVTEPSAAPNSTCAESANSTVGSSSQNITLKNPTFRELRDFIIKDTTSRNDFVLNKYECRHFATEVCNNAEAEGLRCGFVLLGFERGQHAVVAFETTDRGLVFIEPQTDARIHPEVGGKYQGKEIKEILIAW